MFFNNFKLPLVVCMVETSLDKSVLIDKAVGFFSSKGYNLQTQTDSIVVFKSDKREVNWLFFGILCCIGIIPALIYYYFMTDFNQVTISFAVKGNRVSFTATGNTDRAKKDAGEFINSLAGLKE